MFTTHTHYLSHGSCWLWNPWLIWTHSIGDVLTWANYVLIPIVTTIIYVRGRLSKFAASYPSLWRWGAAFIFSCSLTHLGGVAEVWIGGNLYYLTGAIKLLTGLISSRFTYELIRLRWELIFVARAISNLTPAPKESITTEQEA